MLQHSCVALAKDLGWEGDSLVHCWTGNGVTGLLLTTKIGRMVNLSKRQNKIKIGEPSPKAGLTRTILNVNQLGWQAVSPNSVNFFVCLTDYKPPSELTLHQDFCGRIDNATNTDKASAGEKRKFDKFLRRNVQERSELADVHHLIMN